MRTLLTGASGLLGFQIYQDLEGEGEEVWIPNRRGLDIADQQSVSDWISANQPEVIIHCAAYTNVDFAENNDRGKCHLINVKGTRNLALAAAGCGCTFVYLSTDYVFDGKNDQPYVETDEGHPLSIYGQTKLWGERLVQEFCGRHYIVRTSGLFGPSENGRGNFVKAILQKAKKGEAIKVVNDQTFSPTFTPDLSRAIIGLIYSRPKMGSIYHCSGLGECSRYDVAVETLRLAGLEVEVTPIIAAELGRPAPRPKYSYLDKGKITRDLWEPRPWQEMLAEYVEQGV